MPSAKLRLIIDTREQLPLEFPAGAFDEVGKKGLWVGDYGAEASHDGSQGEWKEIPIVFERKSIADLFGTMTNGYDRFKREMWRAKEASITLIIAIEGSYEAVSKGYEYSQYDGSSMLKKLAMLYVRYGIVSQFFNDRREMTRYIWETFDAVRRNYK